MRLPEPDQVSQPQSGRSSEARRTPSINVRYRLYTMFHHSPVKPAVRNSEVYLARAEACRTEADGTALPNVREQLLRAAVAWQEMHEKARKFEELQGRPRT